jgi:hypothetical protein
MRWHQRSFRAPISRARRSFHHGLEVLETRELLSSAPSALADVINAPVDLANELLSVVNENPSGYTPAQIRTAYGISGIQFGNSPGDGAGQTIAIVDAYDDPDLVDSTSPQFSTSDLARFDAEFGLPDPPSFLKINENGGTTNLPPTDPAGPGNPYGNWEVEEALDVEWAHAVAPAANIVLVECDSINSNDLYQGVIVAASYPGVSAVSISWGTAEFSGEQAYDSDFSHAGVTFVASTGDDGAPGEYPATSPYVLAVGGTDANIGPNGQYLSESAWSNTGGGTSAYEPEPSYQDGVQSTGQRTIPDVAFDGDPDTGVAVYDSYDAVNGQGDWQDIGGTSMAAPCWAGLIAIANQGRVQGGGSPLAGSTEALADLYALPATDFHDITTGSNGGFSATVGYDEVSGLGTPLANLIVPALAGTTPSTTIGVTTNAGPPTVLAIVEEPAQAVTAGAGISILVVAQSSDGDVSPDYDGILTISLEGVSGTAGTGGSFTTTFQDGVAAINGLTITSAGSYTLLVESPRLSAVTSSEFTVLPAAPAQLAIIAEPPSSVRVGGGFSLEIAVEDQFGNIVTTESDISIALALAHSSAKGKLEGTPYARAIDGIATFSGLAINKVGQKYLIDATSAGLAGVDTDSITVLAAKPAVRTKVRRGNHVAQRRRVVKLDRPHRAVRLAVADWSRLS